MSTWRRPFALRLLAGLLIAALAWAVPPGGAQAHGGDAQAEGRAALSAVSHEGAAGLACGQQAACAPTPALEPVSAAAFAAAWRPLRVRAGEDRRTHLHRHAHEPPPPRASA